MTTTTKPSAAALVPAPLVPEHLEERQLSNAEYHQSPGISSSLIKALVTDCPARVWSRYVNPNRKPVAPTPAMRLGTIVHSLTLEGIDAFNAEFEVITAARNTKAGKDQVAAALAAGKDTVTEAEFGQAKRMADAVHAHPIAGPLLAEGTAERSFFFSDRRSGESLKVRTDWLQSNAVIDLKTCLSVEPAAFAKAAASMAYPVQQAHYQLAFPDRDFLFICVDKDPDLPQVAVYKLDAAAVALGQRQWRQAFRRLIECRRTDHWPSYSGSESGVIELSLPPWAEAIGEPPEHSIAPGLVPPGFSE